jgi:hypothetical protein
MKYNVINMGGVSYYLRNSAEGRRIGFTVLE